eukprot:gene12305-biopygen7930
MGLPRGNGRHNPALWCSPGGKNINSGSKMGSVQKKGPPESTPLATAREELFWTACSNSVESGGVGGS